MHSRGPTKNGLVSPIPILLIEIHTMVEKPTLSKFQTVQYIFGQKIWPFLHFKL